jgi:hypothetical protein
MAKRRAESQIASLTSDQKKSRIDPIYLAADDVPHTIGMLSYNFASDLTSIRGFLVKLLGSKVAGVPAGAILGLPRGSLEREKPFGCGPRGEVQSIL